MCCGRNKGTYRSMIWGFMELSVIAKLKIFTHTTKNFFTVRQCFGLHSFIVGLT